MTAKTTRLNRKANSKLDMPIIRRRAKLAVKKKHGKKIKLSDVDKVWKDYVEYAIIRPLLYRSIANIEDHFSVHLIGKPYSERLLKILAQGYNVGRFGLKLADKWNRRGLIYKLSFVDKKVKGQIIFEADAKFKKRVVEKLNGSEYVRLEL